MNHRYRYSIGAFILAMVVLSLACAEITPMADPSTTLRMTVPSATLRMTRGHVPVIPYRDPQTAQPAQVTPDDQRTTTARAQTVDLMRAAHAPPTNVGRRSPTEARPQPKLTPRQAHDLMARQLAQAHPDTYAPIHVVPAAQVRTWLDDVRPQAYRDALVNDVE